MQDVWNRSRTRDVLEDEVSVSGHHHVASD